MSRELGEEEEKEDVGRCIGDSIARGTIAAELNIILVPDSLS